MGHCDLTELASRFGRARDAEEPLARNEVLFRQRKRSAKKLTSVQQVAALSLSLSTVFDTARCVSCSKGACYQQSPKNGRNMQHDPLSTCSAGRNDHDGGIFRRCHQRIDCTWNVDRGEQPLTCRNPLSQSFDIKLHHFIARKWTKMTFLTSFDHQQEEDEPVGWWRAQWINCTSRNGRDEQAFT